MADRVFFYGTLMSGFRRSGRERIDSQLQFEGRGWIRAALFDLGIYPAAVPASDGRVWGELYEFSNPSVVLIATLSTQPGTSWVSGRQLARAAASVRPFVQGFQLNLTRRSARAAVAFLRTIPAFRG